MALRWMMWGSVGTQRPLMCTHVRYCFILIRAKGSNKRSDNPAYQLLRLTSSVPISPGYTFQRSIESWCG